MRPPDSHPQPADDTPRTLHALGRHSFSDDAARLVAARRPELQVVNQPDIGQVWEALKRGQIALIPFENSSDGVVRPHLDRLLREECRILFEVVKSIRMCVAGKKGADLSRIHTVRSHPKALGQCQPYIRAHGWAERETASTVAAVQSLLEEDDPGIAALGSESAILANADLDLLDADVAILKGHENQTQMYGVAPNGHERHIDPEKPFHAMDLVLQNRLGVLQDVLSLFRDADVDLLSLHSCPTDGDAYLFFLEMEKLGSEARFARLYEKLQRKAAGGGDVAAVRAIGSWSDRYEDIPLAAPPPHEGYVRVLSPLADPSADTVSLEVTPHNSPGVLERLLRIVRRGGDLTSLQSHSIGRKRYRFDMTMRSRGTKDMEDLAETLAAASEDVAELRWKQ